MKKFTRTDVSEQQLEDIVRRHPELIEEGLTYVDHQKSAAGGRLDVLLVDSGKALVVAELKVVQDDGMLLQGLDYYDYISTNLEKFARLYKHHGISPAEQVRLLLIAPSFSQGLVNRCKWLNVPVTLFTYSCLKFEDDDDLAAVFNEQQLPSAPAAIEVFHIDDHLNYITDESARTNARSLLDEIRSWKPANITLDAIKDNVSMKINNRVFAYLGPRRKSFWVGTYDMTDEWKWHAILTDDDLKTVKPLIKAAMERRLKG
jgi:hypothetical protein